MDTTQGEELTIEQMRDLLRQRDVHPCKSIIINIINNKGDAAHQEGLVQSLETLLESSVVPVEMLCIEDVIDSLYDIDEERWYRVLKAILSHIEEKHGEAALHKVFKESRSFLLDISHHVYISLSWKYR